MSHSHLTFIHHRLLNAVRVVPDGGRSLDLVVTGALLGVSSTLVAAVAGVGGVRRLAPGRLAQLPA